MTPQQMIAVIASAVIAIAAAAGFVWNVFASTVEIPTYSDEYPVTGPDGTRLIDLKEGASITEGFPFVNSTATVNITEYQTCVSDNNQTRFEIQNDLSLNVLDPYFKEVMKNDSMIDMKSCIYTNSENQ